MGSTEPFPAHSARPRLERGPVVLLIGDVALAHDIGGLLAAKRLGLELTIVLLNNEGGGIFDFLPVRRRPPIAKDVYTRTHRDADRPRLRSGRRPVWTEPRDRRRCGRSARGTGARAGDTRVGDRRSASERGANVELHRRVWDAVAGALNS